MVDLNNIRIASPCSVPWDSMNGDDRARHCQSCDLNVHNIEGLTRREVENLITDRQGRLCIRLYRRSDGTVITRDCPLGVSAFRRRVARMAATAFAAILGLFSVSYGQKSDRDSKDAPPVKIERVKTDTKTGEMVGTLMDPNGAVIPGIKIELKKPDGTIIKTKSNDVGVFVLKDLAPGKDYSISIKANDGFKARIVNGIVVDGGVRSILRLQLDVVSDVVVVGVIADDSLIDMSSSTVETVISGEKLKILTGNEK